MQKITEVSDEQISNLSDINLSKLLLKLLHLEHKKFRFENCKIISVPFNINVADGGEDGRIECSDTKESLCVQNPKTLYQCKAYNLEPSKCKNEILNNGKLKPRIKEILDVGGAYVVFMGHSLNKEQIDERVDKIREAIKESEETYYDTAEIDIFDSNKIKDWVNHFLSAVLFVHKCSGISVPLGLQTWYEWSSYKHLRFKFQTNTEINNIIHQIKKNANENKITRILGLSGIGKTRLVFETFRSPLKEEDGSWDINQKELSDAIVYLNAADCRVEDVISFVKNYCCEYRALLIVDNCASDLHLKLADEVRRKDSLFQLITIDHELKIETGYVSFEIIKIENKIYKDLIFHILKEEFKDRLSDNVLRQVSEYTEGYPQMAVLFSNAIIGGEDNLSNMLDEDIMKKLIFGRQEANPEELKFLKVCSLFTFFAFPIEDVYEIYDEDITNRLEEEARYIQDKLCKITWEDFNVMVNKFLERGIMERRGNAVIVRPLPLALKLAVKWWSNTPPSDISSIFESLISQGKLGGRAVDRLSQLNNLRKAKQIVARLWGPNAPFTQAEVLNTGMGSRLFRSVVVVNPEVTLKALMLNYSEKSIEELKEVNNGRRNLIWALEKLCFRKETFLESAKLMMSFAAAEIERIGNNATGQFVHLFKINLSGTEADFTKRIKVLKWGLSKNIREYDKLVISACSSALDCFRFSRFGSAERQGSSKPLEDYSPETWEEIGSYWNEILEILLGFALNGDLSKEAEEVIINHTYCLFHFNYPNDKIEKLFNDLSQKENFRWLDTSNNLKRILEDKRRQRLRNPLSTESIALIEKLIEQFKPTEIEDIIFSTVSQPEWERLEKDERGTYIRKPEAKAKELAKKLTADGVEINEYLKNLLKGEQRHAFAFGHEYGALNKYEEKLLDNTLSNIRLIPEKERNIAFLLGYLSSLSDKNILDQIFSIVLTDAELKNHAFEVVKFIKPTIDDIEKLFQNVEENPEQVFRFGNLAWGPTIDNFTPKEIIPLFKRIQTYNDRGKWVVIDLMYRHIRVNEKYWNEYKVYFQSLISNHNFFTNQEYTSHTDFNEWITLVIKLLKNKKVDNELSEIISNHIIEYCTQVEYINNENKIQEIIDILFDNFFEKIWTIWGTPFIGNNFFAYMNLQSLITNRGGHGKSLLFKYEKNYPILLKWADDNIPQAPEVLIDSVPLSIQIDGETKFHPFTKLLIDNYGHIPSVLDHLNANMGTSGIVSSRVPLYTHRKKLCEQLLNHPKPEVKKWAVERVESYRKAIIEARINEEEEDLY